MGIGEGLRVVDEVVILGRKSSRLTAIFRGRYRSPFLHLKKGLSAFEKVKVQRNLFRVRPEGDNFPKKFREFRQIGSFRRCLPA